MSASDKAFKRGLAMMRASTPDGNTWPRNEEEWNKAVAAHEQMGMPKAQARALAKTTHGGRAGRLLLETAQQADRDRHE